MKSLSDVCVPVKIVDDVDKLVQQLVAEVPEVNGRKRHIVIMSNGALVAYTNALLTH